MKKLLLCHALIALLIGSLLWPVTAEWWHVIDLAVFKFLNHIFLQGDIAKHFWAIMNQPATDFWLEDVFFLFLLGMNLYQTPQRERKKCIVEMLFCLVLITLTIIVINRLIFRDLLVIRRLSPTLSVVSFINLAEYLPTLDFKIYSTKSFPGDHATTAILFATLFWTFARKPLALLAGAFALFYSLPRLIIGAHWLSDILVGSTSVILFAMSWAYFTPFKRWICTFLEKLLFAKYTRAKRSRAK